MAPTTILWTLTQLAEFHKKLKAGQTITFKFRELGGRWRTATAVVGEPKKVSKRSAKSNLVYPLTIKNGRTRMTIQFGIPPETYQFADMSITPTRKRSRVEEDPIPVDDDEELDSDWDDDVDSGSDMEEAQWSSRAVRQTAAVAQSGFVKESDRTGSYFLIDWLNGFPT